MANPFRYRWRPAPGWLYRPQAGRHPRAGGAQLSGPSRPSTIAGGPASDLPWRRLAILLVGWTLGLSPWGPLGMSLDLNGPTEPPSSSGRALAAALAIGVFASLAAGFQPGAVAAATAAMGVRRFRGRDHRRVVRPGHARVQRADQRHVGCGGRRHDVAVPHRPFCCSHGPGRLGREAHPTDVTSRGLDVGTTRARSPDRASGPRSRPDSSTGGPR